LSALGQAESSQVDVLCWDAPATSDLRACQIAAFLGAGVRTVSLAAAVPGKGESRCLIVDAETFAKAADTLPAGTGGVRSLTDGAEHIFIYGFQPTDRHAAILREMSSGGLVGVQPLPGGDSKFHVAEGHREWCGPFSGLSLGAVEASRENALIEGTNRQQQEVMIRAGDRPFFVRAKLGGSQVFFLACSELADLDEKVPRGKRPLSWFSRLAPLMMFLRGALGDRVWRNDHPRACFIIDDPLLKSRYGFLEYRRLLEIMRRRRFSACIAFIPWNYRRSSKEVAALVSSHGDQLFLCVHGCDHTREEFATTDFESLREKARLALERMCAHHRLSGVAFDDVMVFPQGRYSAEAVTALKAADYLAGVNGPVCPTTIPEAAALRDCLEVAVTRFADFPLFSRRYPRDLADFAFDLFVGKPALAVEHHGYFRDGYRALETFIEGLNSLEGRLEWSNLATICSRACLTRTAANGDVQVRFYTNRFWLKNDGTETRRYLLFQRQAAGSPLPSIAIDGNGWVCERENDDLKVSLTLEAGQAAHIRVILDESDSPAAARTRTDNAAKVWIRRILCEFRDNYVDTTRVLRGIVSTARNVRSRLKAATA
jgi:hypothetical protein